MITIEKIKGTSTYQLIVDGKVVAKGEKKKMNRKANLEERRREVLSDYIEMYKKAMNEGNDKEMKRIERDLSQLGMDRMTLRILAKAK